MELSDYIKKNNIVLRKCPWCGSDAKPIQAETYDYRYDDMPYKTGNEYSIVCSDGQKKPYWDGKKCMVRTHAYRDDNTAIPDPIAKCIEVWNSAEVYIPLNIVVPSNHIVLERVDHPKQERVPSWFKKRKLAVKFSTQRGIYDHIFNAIKFLQEDDKFIPCRFSLIFQNERCSVSVVSVGKKYGQDHGVINFTEHGCSLSSFGDNRRDSAWLKQPIQKPLFYQYLYDKIEQSGDASPDDKDDEIPY